MFIRKLLKSYSMKKVLPFIVFFLSTFCFAQSNLNFIHPLEQYQKGVEAFNSQDYDEAVQVLSFINENDSIYRSSLVLTARALLYDEKYRKVFDLYEKHKDVKDNYFQQLSNLYGVALIRYENYIEGVKFYQQMLEVYPYFYLYHFNLGKAYELTKQYEKAIESYQTAISLNPNYASSHLALANICYQNHNIAQALMAWDMYLLLSPLSDNAINVLVAADAAVSAKPETEPLGITISSDDESFKEIDNLLNNYIALNKDYKIPGKLEVPFLKQNYALLEMLKTYQGNGGFWSDKYVPLYQKIQEVGLFEPFAYQMIQSSGLKEHQKAVSKSAKARVDFVGWFNNEWLLIAGKNNTSDPKIKYAYNNDGDIQAMGDFDDQKVYNGPFVFYKNGRIGTKGSFDNDKRIEKWQWFGEFGNLIEEVTYGDSGKPEGWYTRYHKNGNLKSKGYLSADSYQGELTFWYENGFLEEIRHFKDDKLIDSTVSFNKLGEGHIETILHYNDGILHGPLIKYYPDGTLKLDVNYDDGDRVGEEKQYFPNGTLSWIYTYSEGKLNGIAKGYYPSGTLHKEGNFLDNNYHGKWLTYYSDGSLQYEIGYNNGELHGEYVFYDYGFDTPTYIYVYTEGELTAYSHYNTEGEEIVNRTKGSGFFAFESFHRNGNKLSVGSFDKKGFRNGLWKFHDYDGVLSSTEYYSKGVMEINDTSFYVNGNIRSIVPYENGVRSGIAKSFYINGALRTMGMYANDVESRLWYTYYVDGTLATKYYYKEGELDGMQYDYAVNGLVSEKAFYKYGEAEYTQYFDSLGSVYAQINYNTDSVGELRFLSGDKQFQYSYVNGVHHGNFIWYFDNGQPEIKRSYVLGKAEGAFKRYHRNGELKEEGNYYNGEQVGKWVSYYDNGQVNTQEFYDERGKNSGEYMLYNKKGILIYQVSYVDGKRHGEAKYFGSNGDLQMARYYRYGELLGYSYPNEEGELEPMIKIESGAAAITAKYANGNLSREYTFEYGVLHNSYIHYYSNGKKESEENYLYGNLQGEGIKYYEDGAVRQINNYLLGEYHGLQQEFFANGSTKTLENYRNGELHGWAKYYRKNGELERETLYYDGNIYETKLY